MKRKIYIKKDIKGGNENGFLDKKRNGRFEEF